MDNLRLILFLAFGLVLFFLWQRWTEWNPQLHIKTTTTQDHFVEEGGGEGFSDNLDIPVMKGSSALQESRENSPDLVPEIPGHTTIEQTRRIRISTDLMRIEINPKGGAVVKLDLLDYPVSSSEPDNPITILKSDHSEFYWLQSGIIMKSETSKYATGAWQTPNQNSVFIPRKWEYDHADFDADDTMRVSMVWTNEQYLTVEKVFTFRRGSYQIDIDHTVDNRTDTVWNAYQYQQINRSKVDQDAVRLIYTYTGAAYFDNTYHKVSFEDIGETNLRLPVTGGWVAMLQHYFVTALLPSQQGRNLFYTRYVRNSGEYIIGLSSSPKKISSKNRTNFSAKTYVGPKLQNLLAGISPGFELVADYGIFTVIAKPLFWLLDKIHGFVGNWGLAIILLTILIKLCFYKLSEASYKSMARMRKFQPQIMALRDKYGDDRKKMNQEVMTLYKREKMNPLGGCLPIVVQIPVFIALYWVLLESVEIRQAPFYLWIHDLSIRDPYFVLPLIMGVSMLLQTRLNPTPPDPVQAKIMLALPIVFTVFFAFFPSGLVLYWCANNILSILQQYYINKKLSDKPSV